MKPLHWDAINPFTGKPFTWDDPNLRWGSPSYYLEPGDPGFIPYPGMSPAKPKKKPFHRRKPAPQAPNDNPITNSKTMSTFQYNVAPNPNGGFTTRPVLGDPVSEQSLLDQTAAASGLTAAQVSSAVGIFLDKILAAAATGGLSTGLLGRLRFRPTSGGSETDPSGFNTPPDLNADVALSFTADAINAWQQTLTLESMGEVGKVSPEIDSILSQENGALNQYSPGTMIEISGDNLKFNKTDVTQGVFFRSGNAAEVRATVYGTVTPTSLSVLVPGTLSGPLTVRVAAFINGSVRSFTYMTPITT